jgi:hypothetical protein
MAVVRLARAFEGLGVVFTFIVVVIVIIQPSLRKSCILCGLQSPALAWGYVDSRPICRAPNVGTTECDAVDEMLAVCRYLGPPGKLAQL